ncbi:MBL fold metallo-hydrolase [Candidatus Woesearchaeota archaeon]|nr:MBL fold metallo-hydrolase [Candidatus Woesearchaeota archaeon]
MKVKVLTLGVHDDRFEEVDGKKIEVTEPINSAVVLLQNEKNVLVDTSTYAYFDEIKKGLEEENLKPDDIHLIINTHRHFDHTQNNHRFPNAEVVSGHSIWYQTKPKVESYGDIEELKLPHIKFLKTPGHAPEHIAVMVYVDEKKYNIAGDAIQEEIMRKQGYKEKEKIESAKKLLDIADVIIPGHGRIIEGEILEELKQVVKSWESKS